MTTEQRLIEAQENLKKVQQTIEGLQKELKNEEKRWKPNVGDEYWIVNSFGVAGCVHREEYAYPEFQYSQRNVFKTEEEAGKHLEYLNALAVVRDDAEDFEPDWSNMQQNKYYIYFDHMLNIFDYGCSDTYQFFGIYFKSREAAENSIEKHRKEWLTVFGIEGDK